MRGGGIAEVGLYVEQGEVLTWFAETTEDTYTIVPSCGCKDSTSRLARRRYVGTSMEEAEQIPGRMKDSHRYTSLSFCWQQHYTRLV